MPCCLAHILRNQSKGHVARRGKHKRESSIFYCCFPFCPPSPSFHIHAIASTHLKKVPRAAVLMECPIRTPVCTDEDKQDQDRVRLSELCRTRDELFADVSGPMVPRSFSESISSFVTYSPLDIDGTNTGPLFFLPRAELDQDLRSALAPTWRHLDEGNAEFVYSVDMSEWFAVSWDSVVRADYDGADCPESEDWDLCL